MIRARSLFLSVVTSALWVAGPVSAEPDPDELTWQDAPAVAFDVMLLRPLSAVATIVGAPLFVASLPFVAPSGRVMESLDVFVLTPADYTVTRRLGDF